MACLDAYHASGRFGRSVPIRLRPGTDVLDGVKRACEQYGVTQGAVLVGIGSLRQLSFQVLIPKPETTLGAGYTEPMIVEGPVEILSLQGVIFQSEERDTLLHVHGTFADQHGKVYAGHVVPGANPVLATLDAIIAEIEGVRLVRRMEPEVGMGLYTPEST